VATLLAHVLPLALLGALMPTRLALVTSLLGTDRPRTNAIAFSLACTAGYLVMAAFSGAVRAVASHFTGIGPHSLAPLELALGACLLGYLAWTVATWSRERTGSGALLVRVGSLGPGRAALLGLGLGLTSLRCVAVLIEVSTLVVEDGFGRAVMVTILLLTVLVFSLPMLVPIGAYLLASDRLVPVLATVRLLLEGNSRWITVLVTGLLGAYLAARGVVGLELTDWRL
jgi:Sap, sulfolipid-1-addressing protein